MSVDIEPQELTFRRPFTVEVSETLKIKNPNKSPIAFKVKTTAPKQYCVRPNSGRVEPGQDVEVTVLLQAMKQEPPPDSKCRDKFLVQSVSITGDKEFSSVPNILDTTDKATIQERKIRVIWANPEGGDQGLSAAAATPSRLSAVNESEGTPDVTHRFSSPGEGRQTSAPPPYTSDSSPLDDTPHKGHQKQQPVAAAAAAASSSVSAATTAVSHAAQLTYEELKARLQQAETQLATINENGGLRQRIKTESEKLPSTEQVATAVRQGVEGVPVRLVAILCLVSFLLAYFFF